MPVDCWTSEQYSLRHISIPKHELSSSACVQATA